MSRIEKFEVRFNDDNDEVVLEIVNENTDKSASIIISRKDLAQIVGRLQFIKKCRSVETWVKLKKDCMENLET